MRKLTIFYFQILIFIQLNYAFGQKENFDSGIDLYDTSEELVPLRKHLKQWQVLSTWKSNV